MLWGKSTPDSSGAQPSQRTCGAQISDFSLLCENPRFVSSLMVDLHDIVVNFPHEASVFHAFPAANHHSYL